MPSKIADEELGQAVLQSVRDGSYPSSEELISADVPPTALPVVLQLLDHAREEVKVCTTLRKLNIMYLLTYNTYKGRLERAQSGHRPGY